MGREGHHAKIFRQTFIPIRPSENGGSFNIKEKYEKTKGPDKEFMKALRMGITWLDKALIRRMLMLEPDAREDLKRNAAHMTNTTLRKWRVIQRSWRRNFPATRNRSCQKRDRWNRPGPTGRKRPSLYGRRSSRYCGLSTGPTATSNPNLSGCKRTMAGRSAKTVPCQKGFTRSAPSETA